MKPKVPSRRFPYRSVVPTVLVASVLLPFVFIRAALLALDGGCLGWRFAPRFFHDSSQDFEKELRRIYLDLADEEGHNLDSKLVNAAPDSLDDLISEMSSPSFYQHLDLKTFLLKTEAMLVKMDQKVQSARLRALMFQHFASVGIPRSMNCLSLKLAEEYLLNAVARSSLPPPEYASSLTNNSCLHIALITDNILAAAVVVSSTMASSANAEKIVFHIITDKKTYTSMHAWFALHPIFPAIMEVKGLHQFDFPPDVDALITDTIEELHRSSSAFRFYKGEDAEYRRLLALKPSTFSLLNYMRIYLPELFPKLEKVIFLDDDVVVQKDLIPLWHLDLHGLVMGAVSLQESNGAPGDSLCIGKTFSDYINFSSPMLKSSSLGSKRDQCAWLEGMNIFDIRAWRKHNITRNYLRWLKLNHESGFTLWPMGSLPPALFAFDGKVLPIKPSWLLSGLGWQMADTELLESSAIVHMEGPGKPWLETGFPELRKIWRSHLNKSDEFIRSCMVLE